MVLKEQTRGAAETINIGINKLNEERDIPVICLDSDNFYTCDIISLWNGENCIFSFERHNALFIISLLISFCDTNSSVSIKLVSSSVVLAPLRCILLMS